MLNLCFDCDDTLYDLQEPFNRSVKQFIPVLPVSLPFFYKVYRKVGDRVFDLEHEHVITSDDVGIYRIYGACIELSIPFTLEQAADFQDAYRKYQGQISMQPVLHEFFASTSARVSILTNGQEGHQKDKVRTLGMYDYIGDHAIFTSEGIGYAKPDAKAFQTVCDRLSIPYDTMYYIGDNYIKDMEGAKAAGLHTIHFNRHNLQEGMASDYIVYNEDQLVALLKELERRES